MLCLIPKPFNNYKSPFYGNILYGACNITVVLVRRTVTEQRVTGFLFASSQWEDVNGDNDLAASFMSGGGSWSISEFERLGYAWAAWQELSRWRHLMIFSAALHSWGSMGASKVAWGWSQARQLSREGRECWGSS
jgi:hypothetical protein